jgi:hypothetical protein
MASAPPKLGDDEEEEEEEEAEEEEAEEEEEEEEGGGEKEGRGAQQGGVCASPVNDSQTRTVPASLRPSRSLGNVRNRAEEGRQIVELKVGGRRRERGREVKDVGPDASFPLWAHSEQLLTPLQKDEEGKWENGVPAPAQEDAEGR